MVVVVVEVTVVREVEVLLVVGKVVITVFEAIFSGDGGTGRNSIGCNDGENKCL